MGEISLRQAHRLILKKIHSSAEAIALPPHMATGFVLAEDIFCSEDSPPHPKSKVDGFAVASDRESYKLAGEIQLSQEPPEAIKEGYSYMVRTGSYLPSNVLRVIRKENVKAEGDLIYVLKKERGKNYLRKGEECKKGRLIFNKGYFLSEKEAAFLQQVGVEKVRVFRKPRVIVVPLGSELVGQAVNPAGLLIKAFAERAGAEAKLKEPLEDEVDKISRSITDLASSNDIIITIGGTGVSNKDLTESAVLSAGAVKVFKRVRVQPGRTTGLYLLRGKPILALPGNVQAAVASFFAFFFEVSKAEGFSLRPPSISGKLVKDIKVKQGWARGIYVKVKSSEGEIKISPIREVTHSSKFLIEANGLLIAKKNIAKGSLARCYLI